MRTRTALLAALAGFSVPGAAAVVEVGPDQQFRTPSAAIAAAADGDTVRIAPGQYDDCAFVRHRGLTIEGAGPDTVLTDLTCAGKAILVVDAPDVTIRALTLQRARVADRNGAGIRAEGGHLTVERVHFNNNEAGILAADGAGSEIRVRDSEFRDNGRCPANCTDAIDAGHIGLLSVANSRFVGTRGGYAIRSWADNNEIIGDDILDGPSGTARGLVDIASGGALTMTGNRLQKGPEAAADLVLLIGDADRGEPTAKQIVQDNTLTAAGPAIAALVLNWGAADPVVSGNTVPAGVEQLSTAGAFRHRLRGELYEYKQFLLKVVIFAKRGVHFILAML